MVGIFLRGELNEFIDLLPVQQRVDEEHWYRGTADAVYQNIDILRSVVLSSGNSCWGSYIQDGLFSYAANKALSHDFDKDIIPRIVKENQALVHPFSMSCVPRDDGVEPYWLE